MRNVLDKSCRKNQNTHFKFNNFFAKNCAVYETMPKNELENEGAPNDVTIWRPRVAAGLARLYARMRMHTPTRPSTNMHARTHAQNNK
jgi:hypothetical protein